MKKMLNNSGNEDDLMGEQEFFDAFKIALEFLKKKNKTDNYNKLGDMNRDVKK
jgi:hypothetical protein